MTDNAILRVQAENEKWIPPSQFKKAKYPDLQIPPNTSFTNNNLYFQVYLEQISDYLIQGPNVWWKQPQKGALFLDGPGEDYTNMADGVHSQLFQK